MHCTLLGILLFLHALQFRRRRRRTITLLYQFLQHINSFKLDRVVGPVSATHDIRRAEGINKKFPNFETVNTYAQRCVRGTGSTFLTHATRMARCNSSHAPVSAVLLAALAAAEAPPWPAQHEALKGKVANELKRQGNVP